MSRRIWLVCVGWCLTGIASLVVRRRTSAQDQQATLNETLRAVLKCRRPQEFAFVDLVVQKVEQGKLSRSMVLSTMDWARKRSRAEAMVGRRSNDIPFPYFQEGLRRQAEAIGVELPAFQPLLAQ